MAQQVPVSQEARVDARGEDGLHEPLPDVAYQRLAIVNVLYIGNPGDRESWVLVDAGVMGTAGLIQRAVGERFGDGARPRAIVMTHGHFDHVGALRELAERWNVPIFAHELEFPCLNGTAAYPPPDPSVGGGLMAATSQLYPRDPVNVEPWLQPLASDGSIPVLPGWQWIHTPGHTPGHISLWRKSDRTLIAGDAFITTAQESAYAVAVQSEELHGPPMYFTQDWEAAEKSVARLAELEPETVITGHGPALRGEAMRKSLAKLARQFQQVAVPEEGRYVEEPARGDKAYAEPDEA